MPATSHEVVRTIEGDVEAVALGFTLAHEHLYADFASSGDADLEFVLEDAALDDLVCAAQDGVRTIVEVTTTDMGADVARAARLGDAAGIRIVKSAGWFRSPSADRHLVGEDGGALGERLVDDVTVGFPGTDFRAGVLGEVGISGVDPTPTEVEILAATAYAARATGAGVILHTDDVANADALIQAFLEHRVPTDRLLVGHARPSDPVGWHLQLLDAGCWIGFDQLGHPERAPLDAVAARIIDLLEHDGDCKIVLSCDVGRKSRLRRNGGGGYSAPVVSLLADLGRRGVPRSARDRLCGGAMAAFLALTPT